VTKKQYELRESLLVHTWVCTADKCHGTGWALTECGAVALADEHQDRYHRPPVPDPTPYYAVIEPRLLRDGFVVSCSAHDWSAQAGTEADCRVLWTVGGSS
jgi:hypothetical protein